MSITLTATIAAMAQEEATCSFYLRTGMCKFGTMCKFNHPDLSEAETPLPTFLPSAIGLPPTLPNALATPPLPTSQSSSSQVRQRPTIFRFPGPEHTLIT